MYSYLGIHYNVCVNWVNFNGLQRLRKKLAEANAYIDQRI